MYINSKFQGSPDLCLDVSQKDDQLALQPLVKHSPASAASDSSSELHRLPTRPEIMGEIKQMIKISGPSTATGVLLYLRGLISLMFLGRLGDTELAAASLAIGFANITGYSVLQGLAMGMEPICGQAFGAQSWHVLGITLQRTVLILLCISTPVALLWLNMERLFLWCGQDAAITAMADSYITFLLPDLLAQSLLHPLRIYLRTQNITMPLTYCAAVAVALHVPLNALLVMCLGLGARGVALAAALSNMNLVLLLLTYVCLSGAYRRSWVGLTADCLKGWRPLLGLAIPSCISTCLEWWWYEFMIVLCGLLAEPKASLASMGILIQMTSFVYIFPNSLSLGVSTRVGNELGAGNPGKARTAMIVALSCASVLAVVAMVFATSLRNTWARIFTSDPHILSLTSLALPIVGLCELGNCPQTTGCGVLRGSARPATGANINLGAFYFVGLPVAILLGFVARMGFTGLWLGLLAAQACCAVLMFYVSVTTDWVQEAQRAKQLTARHSQQQQQQPHLPFDHTEICHKAAQDVLCLQPPKIQHQNPHTALFVVPAQNCSDLCARPSDSTLNTAVQQQQPPEWEC